LVTVFTTRFNIQKFYILHLSSFHVFCMDPDKQWSFPYTAVTACFLGAFGEFRKTAISLAMFVCVKQLCSHLTGLREFCYYSIRRLVEKIQVYLKSDKNMGHLTWRRIISRPVLLRMGNVSDKSCTEKKHTFHPIPFLPTNAHFINHIKC